MLTPKAELKIAIMKVVDKIGDPLMKHIIKNVNGYSEEEIKDCVRELVNDGTLRMKEDSYDHDWSYRRNK